VWFQELSIEPDSALGPSFVAVPWYGCPHCLYMAMLSDGLVLQEPEPGFFEEMVSPWLDSASASSSIAVFSVQ
jgi:hypothetical protein